MATKAYAEGSATETICDDFFESIDDLLDFSGDDGEPAIEDACENEDPPALIPSPAGISVGSGGGASFHGRPEDDDLGIHCNDTDMTNLEWLSNFFEDAEFNFELTAATIKDDSLFRSSSPVSVLRSGAVVTGGVDAYSSSYSGGGSILIVPARARTKRPRPLSFSSRRFIPPPVESASVGESFSPARKIKIKRKKESPTPDVGEGNPTAMVEAAVRKCAHCEIQNTPQWRTGPMGPKTLCNACGVRYKSGRLFPEYRPAASPTFVPALHSNSHKKVVEMRMAVASKNYELIEYIRRAE